MPIAQTRDLMVTHLLEYLVVLDYPRFFPVRRIQSLVLAVYLVPVRILNAASVAWKNEISNQKEKQKGTGRNSFLWAICESVG